MAAKKLQETPANLWALVRSQHGVVARRQLLAAGLTASAIRYRITAGRLHPIWRGVYAVGRPDVDQLGLWMAAVLSCGDAALLSHGAAASLWGLRPAPTSIDIVVPIGAPRRRRGIRVHQRSDLDVQGHRALRGIPVTNIVSTLLDLASRERGEQVERAVNEADRLDLVDPGSLRAAIESLPCMRPGRAQLRALLDARTFALTDSELERRFLRVVRDAGLPLPETQVWLNGFRVDFYWPALGLVVETDGLRYHRTPGQQAKDRLRDQAQTMAGLTVLRFTAAQVRHEASRVQATLVAVTTRLADQS